MENYPRGVYALYQCSHCGMIWYLKDILDTENSQMTRCLEDGFNCVPISCKGNATVFAVVHVMRTVLDTITIVHTHVSKEGANNKMINITRGAVLNLLRNREKNELKSICRMIGYSPESDFADLFPEDEPDKITRPQWLTLAESMGTQWNCRISSVFINETILHP